MNNRLYTGRQLDEQDAGRVVRLPVSSVYDEKPAKPSRRNFVIALVLFFVANGISFFIGYLVGVAP